MNGGYEIRVRHRLGQPVTWILRDLEPRCGQEDDTILRVDATDQATVYGVLARLADLGLEILSVERIESSDTGR